MACLGCSCGTDKGAATKDGAVKGCSSGGCASGGCNRHNTYDWITAAGIRDVDPFDLVEVSFKNGSRKEFFKNPAYTRATTGDDVLVESASGGYDVGRISLSGELVRLQMKRKRVREDSKFQSVIRKAHERDMERLDEVRKMEKSTMINARVITRTLDLNMKICDVEFQGDGRKCTFYYTADGRVDFRELIRHYAKEFKVKIEMRQIGARQESSRIGGLGNCGRELCCSTWLHEFKSVNTAAARYQNLAINQTKLSGMCGRLKCCLNYELDTYIDALEDFPEKAERVKTKAGLAILVKTDVFKRLMFYTYAENRHKFYPMHVDQVWEALEMIKNGDIPGSLEDIQAMAPPPTVEEEVEETFDYENVHDVVQLPFEKKKKKKKKKGREGFETKAAAIEKAPLEGGGAANRRDGRGGNDRSKSKNDRPSNRGGSSQQSKNAEKPMPIWEDRSVKLDAPDSKKQQPKQQPKPRPENPNQAKPKQENQQQKPKPENQNQPRPKQENQQQKPRPENQNQPRPKQENQQGQQTKDANPNQKTQQPNQRPPQKPRPENQQQQRPRPENPPQNKPDNTGDGEQMETKNPPSQNSGNAAKKKKRPNNRNRPKEGNKPPAADE